MTEHIQPALSAEEWVRAQSGTMFIEDVISRPFSTIAALNHLLPDDDPRRITTADLEAIDAGLNGISCVESELCCSQGERDVTNAERIALTALRAKLEALLPPR